MATGSMARSSPSGPIAASPGIPPLAVKSLLFIEDRYLLDQRYPERNPAIEWNRFALAAAGRAASLVVPHLRQGGGSTLATQIEKFRHSPRGLTGGVGEKFRQMLTASARAYLRVPTRCRDARRSSPPISIRPRSARCPAMARSSGSPRRCGSGSGRITPKPPRSSTARRATPRAGAQRRSLSPGIEPLTLRTAAELLPDHQSRLARGADRQIPARAVRRRGHRPGAARCRARRQVEFPRPAAARSTRSRMSARKRPKTSATSW